MKLEERINFMTALVLAVANKYNMTARDAVGMVMTSKYAKGDFVPEESYTTEQIEKMVSTL